MIMQDIFDGSLLAKLFMNFSNWHQALLRRPLIPGFVRLSCLRVLPMRLSVFPAFFFLAAESLLFIALAPLRTLGISLAGF